LRTDPTNRNRLRFVSPDQQARSSSSGARSEMEFITIECDVKRVSCVAGEIFEKNFLAVVRPNEREDSQRKM
jgi:hypothetical protein